ncbi:hypothetical protein EGW08_014158 [Elysia chlorotica]|uniref:LITAF domain-containing protein n=1 Tax=Elysia chlorotica TaxID=188477 RepID=A0A3S1B7U2_ELYCH|nr:hypothetical protein EGW08_014158 [Elysia chlorotica]
MVPSGSVYYTQPTDGPALRVPVHGCLQIYGTHPALIQCQYCGQTVYTFPEPRAGALTILLSLLLVIWGCFLCCWIIPFWTNFGKDVEHRCPSCGYIVGVYKPL